MAHVWRGKEVAEQLAEKMRREVAALQERGCRPKLAVLLVQGDPTSSWYARAKAKAAQSLGILCEVVELPHGTLEAEVVCVLEAWNVDPQVHGILVELPLPAHIRTQPVLSAIDPLKDVDGVTPASKLALMTGGPALLPATPLACLELLRHYGFPLAGKHAVIIGRGETVGRPLQQLLLRENATVTVCHSKTADLRRHVQAADVVFAAAGSRGLITAEMVHERLVLIDAGMSETPDGGLAGDVDPAAAKRAAAFTPVPGGVGPVTTMLLLRSLLQAIPLQEQRRAGAAVPDDPFARSVRSFLQEAASAAPTPGGGGAAALAAALGAAMGAMTARLSSGAKYAAWEVPLAACLQAMEEAMPAFARLAEQDEAAFRAYMSARKLPADSPESRALRAEALSAAAERAAEVPLELMRRCRIAAAACVAAGEGANPHLLSDLGIAGVLLLAAAESAWLTVSSNLPAICRTDRRVQIAEEAAGCLGEVRQRKTELLRRIGTRLDLSFPSPD